MSDPLDGEETFVFQISVSPHSKRGTGYCSWTPAQTVHYNTRMTSFRLAQCSFWGTLILFLWISGTPGLLADEGQPYQSDIRAQTERPDFAALNIRLSQRPVSPPEKLVKGNVNLSDVQAARILVGPSPQAAILEDDHHRRVLILSMLKDGRVHAQLLTDIDLTPSIPFISACAQDRGCAQDRRPVTGGLGCIAICVQQALDPNQTR